MTQPDDARTCSAVLEMYDGEYEGECELLDGHDGAHWDGLTTWRTDDDGWTDRDTIDLEVDRREPERDRLTYPNELARRAARASGSSTHRPRPRDPSPS